MGNVVEKLGDEQFANALKQIKDINEQTGLGRDRPIAAEMDAQYNNPLRSGGGGDRTPGQPATQTTLELVENFTSQKKVIGVYCGNKLCAKHNKPHQNCKKNLSDTHIIGDEKSHAASLLREIQEGIEPISISYLTTDGDSKAFTGAAETQDQIIGVKMEHLSDIIHLNKTFARALNKITFSRDMFPGKNKSERDKIQHRFCKDMQKRVHSEFENAFKHVNGNIDDLIKVCSYIPDAIIACYNNNCGESCQKYSRKSASKWWKSVSKWCFSPIQHFFFFSIYLT